MIETFDFTRATRKQVRARIALTGPTGSGKTYTALVLATTFGGDPSNPDRVGFIDTENGSASTFADEFNFRVLELAPPFSPERYAAAINAAVARGFKAVVVDSASHEWMGTGGVLEIVDHESERMKGNKYAAWNKGTAEHNRFIDAIVRCPIHIICCLRTKMAYVQEDGKVRKLGMEPIQREGMEYEFTLVADLSLDHTLVVTKSRLRALDGVVVGRPGRVFAKTILEELEQGEAAPEAAQTRAAAAPATNGAAPTRLRQPVEADIPGILAGVHPVPHESPTGVAEWREKLRWHLDEAAGGDLVTAAGLLQSLGTFPGKSGKPVVPESLAKMKMEWVRATYGKLKEMLKVQAQKAAAAHPPENAEEAADQNGLRFKGEPGHVPDATEQQEILKREAAEASSYAGR